MCSTCGCGRPDQAHPHPGSGEHTHDHGHDHGHEGTTTSVLRVEQALLAENDRFAAYNRGFFDGKGIRCFNLISAPGSGKTTLLEKTLDALLAEGIRCTVVEGDQQTDNDARRIARTGARVHQIQTGRACHLDAHQVQHALEHLQPEGGSLVFIENVGNLICPTEFDLGEQERVAMLSVTEGTDKPAKYPLAFRTASAVVVAKIDLTPHVDFDLVEARRLIAGLNPEAPVFVLSARTGEGMPAWLTWLKGSPRGAR
jgi:hydrogenase nickel incorporation protein HypB